eukprot:5916425-Pyramimonas_sp.AAC.1
MPLPVFGAVADTAKLPTRLEAQQGQALAPAAREARERRPRTAPRSWPPFGPARKKSNNNTGM